jgi:hypothetical protein
MSVVTILCHGTMNSTNRATSSGSELVISKLSALLAGDEGKDWILNEGAGSKELLKRLGISGALNKFVSAKMGIAAGEGVEANVDVSVSFVKYVNTDPERVGPLTVNLAGHSRGSITCYKIASALFEWNPNLRVNIFAIDPVPGNNGALNQGMYEQIAVRGNVQSSFLMLAESEHRLNFRPYIDDIYSEQRNAKGHKFDTIPGTHGGINELTGSESEAAAIVLDRSLRFLIKRGSLFKDEVARFVLDDVAKLRLYSKLMMRIKRYKAHASVNPFKTGISGLGNLLMSSANVDRHRIVNVAGSKQTWGTAGHQATGADTRGRADHHGMGMNAALDKMGVKDPHAGRTNRFFANKEHQKLFKQQHPAFINQLENLEKSGADKDIVALQEAIAGAQNPYVMMNPATKAYFDAYCKERRVLP